MCVCDWLTQCLFPHKTHTKVLPDLSLSSPEPIISVECLNGVLPSSHQGKTVYRKRTKIYSLSTPHRSISRAPSVTLSLLVQPKRGLIRKVRPLVPHSALIPATISEDLSLSRSYSLGDATGVELDLQGRVRLKKCSNETRGD